jgi:hypothetical protein
MTRLLSTIGLLTAMGILWFEPSAAAIAKPGAPGIDDPFVYCTRIGTVDTPSGGGSSIPLALTPFLRITLGLSAEAPLTPASYYWRCTDGAVYVRAIGANERFDSKADRAKQNAGADSYCPESLAV